MLLGQAAQGDGSAVVHVADRPVSWSMVVMQRVKQVVLVTMVVTVQVVVVAIGSMHSVVLLPMLLLNKVEPLGGIASHVARGCGRSDIRTGPHRAAVIIAPVAAANLHQGKVRGECVVDGVGLDLGHVVLGQGLEDADHVQVLFDRGAVQPHPQLLGQSFHFVSEEGKDNKMTSRPVEISNFHLIFFLAFSVQGWHISDNSTQI